MWPFLVVAFDEPVELLLLLQEVVSRGLGGLSPKMALALANGVPLSVRMVLGSPKSLNARSNTVNAGFACVLVRASQQIR
jgi:hypothetical protein